MQSYKTERQRQLDNVQKELLTNYYLQKYNSIMSGLSKEPENQIKNQINFKTIPSENKSQRMNFKNMILMKKNQNHHLQNRTPIIHNQKSEVNKVNSNEITHKYSSRQEQQNQKTIKKLEESIINELYRPSPSKIQQGSYKKLEITIPPYSKTNQNTNKQSDLELLPQENIEITYEQEPEINQFDEDEALFEQEQQRIAKVKEAIKLEFDRRKDHSLSPRKKSHSRQSSGAKSSKISVQIKIQSPRKLEKAATPNKYGKQKQSRLNFRAVKNENSQRSNSHNASESYDEGEDKHHVEQRSLEKDHQIYYSKDAIEASHRRQYNENLYDQIKQEQEFQFVPPTSNYYKSQNDNLVEQSFKYQEQIRQNKDQESEKAHSIASSRRSSKSKHLNKNDSKKSIRSRQKSQIKDNSKMEMSFVSRMSMLSSNEGFLIKERIEKQLYDNQLGPYQSALYNIVQLMERHPKSGPIFAVGQKTLDDRKIFEERRISQQTELAQLKKNIQRIKKKSQIRGIEREDQTILSNQMQILRLIRKISTIL